MKKRIGIQIPEDLIKELTAFSEQEFEPLSVTILKSIRFYIRNKQSIQQQYNQSKPQPLKNQTTVEQFIETKQTQSKLQQPTPKPKKTKEPETWEDYLDIWFPPDKVYLTEPYPNKCKDPIDSKNYVCNKYSDGYLLLPAERELFLGEMKCVLERAKSKTIEPEPTPTPELNPAKFPARLKELHKKAADRTSDEDYEYKIILEEYKQFLNNPPQS